MDCLALEVVDTRDVGFQRCVVVVVSSAVDDESCTQLCLLPSGIDCECPSLRLGRPVSRQQLVVKANLLVDAIDLCRLADVLANGGAVGDGVGLRPRSPRESKCV